MLACQTKVYGNMTVHVPSSTLFAHQRIKTGDMRAEFKELFRRVKKDFEEKHGKEPMINKITLSLPQPTLDDNLSDFTRLKRAFKKETGRERLLISHEQLIKLPQILRKNDFQVSFYYVKEPGDVSKIVYLEEKPGQKTYALAVDIGTTSISACLIDAESETIVREASCANAQSQFGADVINRIVYSTKRNGLKKLKDTVIQESLNPLIAELAAKSDIQTDQIVVFSVSANTTMTHLLLGVPSDDLRKEPFIPVFTETKDLLLKPSQLGLEINTDGLIVISPNIASYVGGDITAGVITAEIRESESFTVLIDLGTNGEIVVGNSDFLMTCACSAGPAFEGGEISCGMRAAGGAIEKITIDPESFEVSYRVIDGQTPTGICGSGIIDLISELKKTGLIDAKGKFVKEKNCKRIEYDEYGIGRFLIASSVDDEQDKDIYISEIDIDNFIRAKGAVYSALVVLLDSMGFDFDMIETIKIAGGIGSHIDIKEAINIGLFPDIDPSKYEYIGNSSLIGSYVAALNKKAVDYMDDTANNMTYVELSVHPGYMDEFISASFIPHTDLTRFPNHKG
ncbi:MAG TPA: ferredoxin [Eubacteriaceae bacterium]|nr:ferredoxin [Eubacteriaceae bacterium]